MAAHERAVPDVAVRARPRAPLLRRRGAAKYLTDQWGIPRTESTLKKEASRGTGPPYRRAGGVVLYDVEDLDRWAETLLSPKVSRARDLRQAEARP